MSVVNVWCGAVTATSATVVGKVTGSSVRLAVARDADLSAPAFEGPVEPSAQGIVRITASGLKPATRWHYALEVDGELDDTLRGQFLTHPPAGMPATFTIAMATCAGLTSEYPGQGDVLAPARLSNHPVFDTIRENALAEDWLMFIHGGDIHYYDIGSGVHVPDHDLGTYRRAYDDVFLQPRQQALYRNVAVAHIYDDHDFGPNNSDSQAPGAANAVRAYQERVPHYPRGASTPDAPNYQSFVIGRVLFVILDARAARDPNTKPPGPDKTMLGDEQKVWLDSLLSSSDAAFLVVVMPSQWDHPDADDTWGAYVDERNEVTQIFAAPGGDATRNWLGRMCLLQGDNHSLGIASATQSGGFPVFQFAALDSSLSDPQPWKDIGAVSARGQFGTLRFEDSGSEITVRGTGWSGGEKVLHYDFTVRDGGLPATVQNTQRALYKATNQEYDATVTAGSYVDCAVVFTAPPSGQVMLHWSGAPRNLDDDDGSAVAYLSPEVRWGARIGTGTVVLPPGDERSVRTNLVGGVASVRAGASHVLLIDLNPGETYNARLLHRVTSESGQFFQRGIIAAPLG